MRPEPGQTAAAGRRRLGRPALVAALAGTLGLLLVLDGTVIESWGSVLVGLGLMVSGTVAGLALSIAALWRAGPTASAHLALILSLTLAGLIAWGAYEFTRPDPSVSTSETGCYWDPTAAKLPEGALVFLSECSGTYRVWLLDRSGSSPRKLTQGNLRSEDAFPAASPDGRFVAFARGSLDAGHEDIYLLRLANGTIRNVSRDRLDDSDPAWSPDGRRLVYYRWRRCRPRRSINEEEPLWNGTDSFATGACRRGALVARSVDGSRTMVVARVVAGRASPAWSPDGRRIVFSARTGPSKKRDLEIVDLRSGVIRRLTSTPLRDEGDPSWSPDGTWIAFGCRFRTSGVDVCLVHPDGSGFRRLTRRNGADSPAPAWSSSGRWIVFAHAEPGYDHQIWMMRTDGSKQRLVADGYSDSGNANESPSWSTGAPRS